MNKLFILMTMCLLTMQPAVAQTKSEEQGTDFLDNKPMAEALAQAKATGKLLFVDCYTTWCGPCKMMTRDVFPQPTVGKYMNEHFVSLKVDMEKGEGPDLSKRYGVRAYPTFLVLDADGTERTRMVGAAPADKFVATLSELLKGPGLGQLNAQWDGGDRSTDFLRQYYPIVKSAYMRERTQEVAKLLLDGQRESLLTDSLLADVFQSNMPDVLTDTYIYVWDHRQEFRQRYGDAFDRNLIRAWEYAPYQYMSGKGKDTVLDEARMKAYVQLMEKKGVEHRDELAAMGYINYALTAQRWKEFMQRVDDYRKSHEISAGLYRHWGIPIQKMEDANDPDLSAVQQWLRERIAETTPPSNGNSVPAMPLRQVK